MQVTVDIDTRAFLASVAEAKGALAAAKLTGLNRAGQRFEREVKRATPVKSGRLRSQIGYAVRGDELDVGVLSGTSGAGVVYARQVEFGGTITPKSSRFLAIPLGAMKTKAGVGGIRARDVISDPGQFGYEDTFFAKGVLFGKSGKSITPLFALKSSVTTRPHPYLIPTVTKNLGFVDDEIAKAAQETGKL